MTEAEVKAKLGIINYRGHQAEVISNILAKRSTMFIARTGSGKSLCFQLPAFVNEGLTLVISPLIALQKDQVDSLKASGFGDQVEYINSQVSLDSRSEILARVRQGKVKLLYCAPEGLSTTSQLWSVLQAVKPWFIVIDEAHCISRWGKDFRPKYWQLGQMIKTLQPQVVLACTATISQRAIKDIVQVLDHKFVYVSEDPIRKDLTYSKIEGSVNDPDDAGDRIALLLREGVFFTPMVVYVLSIKACHAIAKKLAKYGGVAYNAQLPANERTRAQESFMSGKSSIVVATNAFGMGVNKKDIRTVIHHLLPLSLEEYVQQTGRASRDGLGGKCVVLHSSNLWVQNKRIENSNPSYEVLFKTYSAIAKHKNAPEGYLVCQEEDFASIDRFALGPALQLLESFGLIESHVSQDLAFKVLADFSVDKNWLQEKLAHDKSDFRKMQDFVFIKKDFDKKAFLKRQLSWDGQGCVHSLDAKGYCASCRKGQIALV
jgi:ATP-dependent DNA helicase RecQ